MTRTHGAARSIYISDREIAAQVIKLSIFLLLDNISYIPYNNKKKNAHKVSQKMQLRDDSSRSSSVFDFYFKDQNQLCIH